MERIRHRKRTFSVFPGDDGMYIVRGVVDPEVGALLMRATEAASDALYEAGLSWSAEGGAYGPTTEEVKPEQRRADALALVAERAMAAGFGMEAADERDEEEEGEAAVGPVEDNSLAGFDVEGACSDDRGRRGSEPAVRIGSAERDSPAGAAVPNDSKSTGGDPGSGEQTGSAERGGRASVAIERESEARGDEPCNGQRRVSTERSGRAPTALESETEVGGCEPGIGGQRVSAERGGRASAALESESKVSGAEPGDGGERVSAERGGRISSATTSGADKPTVCRCGQAGRASPPLSGTRAERYMVVVHMSPSTLKKDGEVGRSNLQDGTRLSAETARRLSCDCSLVNVTRGEEGEVLNVGRKRRTISPALRRALEIRDGGCRFPGCGARLCDCHHIIHWEDGGETSLSNVCLLCKTHHRAVHEEGFSVRMLSDGTIRFHDRRGWPLPDYAPLAELGEDPVEALIRHNRARGVDPDGWACSARYDRSANIPWELEAGVRDALDPS